MQIEDLETSTTISVLGLKLTPSEAAELRDGLSQLLGSSEAKGHIHVSDEEFDTELTVSLENAAE